MAHQAATDAFDGGGYLTNRVWRQGANVVRTQTFAWDARGRLLIVTDRDASNSGVNWSAVYDAFDRLLRTTEIVVTNGNALTAQAVVIDHYYDPEHEFLETGVSENGRVTWKMLGPDLNGVYGGAGQPGAGGLGGSLYSVGIKFFHEQFNAN